MPADRNTTLILTSDDVAEIVRRVGCHEFMDELIDRLHKAFAEFDSAKVSVPIRDGFHSDNPATGLIEWMPIQIQGQMVLMKLVGYHPDNPITYQIPTVLSTLSLFDAATGSLNTIADGTLLTAMRTGAASAVATRLLSPDDSNSLGLIGCGVQAVTQLHGISRVRSLQLVRFFDTDSVVMNSFSERAHTLLPDGVVCLPASLQDVVEHSEILCTATSIGIGEGPVFVNAATVDTVHVNAVGSDFPGKTELPIELLRRAIVCPDFPAQAVVEGECQQLTGQQIGPSILEVAADSKQWTNAAQQKTVFDSTGWALEDFVALQLVTEWAQKLQVGSQIPIEPRHTSPWDPYENLNLKRKEPVALSAAGTAGD